MKVFIYGFREKGTDLICYVGRTANLKKRLRGHYNIVPPTPVTTWLKANRDNIEMIVIEEVDEGLAPSRERFHIAECSKRNPRLFNIQHANTPQPRTSIGVQRFIGELRLAVESRGITHANIGKALGMKRTSVSRMLSGKISPTMDNLIKIADQIGVEVIARDVEGVK